MAANLKGAVGMSFQRITITVLILVAVGGRPGAHGESSFPLVVEPPPWKQKDSALSLSISLDRGPKQDELVLRIHNHLLSTLTVNLAQDLTLNAFNQNGELVVGQPGWIKYGPGRTREQEAHAANQRRGFRIVGAAGLLENGNWLLTPRATSQLELVPVRNSFSSYAPDCEMLFSFAAHITEPDGERVRWSCHFRMGLEGLAQE